MAADGIEATLALEIGSVLATGRMCGARPAIEVPPITTATNSTKPGLIQRLPAITRIYGQICGDRSAGKDRRKNRL